MSRQLCLSRHAVFASSNSKPSPNRRVIVAAPPLLSLSVSAMAASSDANAASTVPHIELAPGLSISRIIKGCWQLSGGHQGDRADDRTSGKAAVADFQPFVDIGVSTFDTADIYGPSESIIGEYLRSNPEAKQNCQVLTKFCAFGNSMNSARDLKFVEQSIDKSRKALGMDSLDLVQFYWHDYSNKNYIPAILHLSELQAKGKIKHIGVTNFDTLKLAEMVDAGAKIVSNQVQYSLLDRRPELAMNDYCSKNGIKLLPYGTVAGGFLSEKYLGLPPGKVNVNTYSLSKYASVINTAGGYNWLQELLGVLKKIGDKHNVGIAEVASKYILDKPTVAGVIVGARNANHVQQHVKTFDVQFNKEDLESMDEVLAKGIQATADCYSWERGGPW